MLLVHTWVQESPHRCCESGAGHDSVARHELYKSAGVPAAGGDCSALSKALSLLLATGLSVAGLLNETSASSGLEARSGCSLLGLCGSVSPSCLTGSGVSDKGSACFAVGLLAAAALTVFDSLQDS